MSLELTVFPDSAAVARATAEAILACSQSCVKAGRWFSIALAGGSTPKAAYELLATSEFWPRIAWPGTKVFFGDERHVRPDHADSNFRMAYEAMLKKVPLPLENIFAIPTADPDPNACAAEYERLLRLEFPGQEFPRIDLVLLGIGPDGHTASLFPGTPAPLERSRWVTMCDPLVGNPAIKPPVKRVTITAPVIWNAANVLVLATGKEKAPVLQKILSDTVPSDAPVSRLLRDCKGSVRFFVDPAAKP